MSCLLKWLASINRKQHPFYVSEVYYSCFITGVEKKKTVIVLPHRLPNGGLIAIEKPMNEIELVDVLKLYKQVNKA